MKRDSVVWGVILILIGVAFLVFQWRPGLFAGLQWPWFLLGLGAIFAVASVLTRTGGMLVAGLVLLTLGGIFTYQVNTGNWGSWAYVWPLMPAAAGLGLFLGSLYDRDLRDARPVGLILAVAGVVVFAILGGVFGLDPSILRYWPVLLILLGAGLFFRAVRAKR